MDNTELAQALKSIRTMTIDEYGKVLRYFLMNSELGPLIPVLRLARNAEQVHISENEDGI